jgi:uncharacterized membrane protein YeaQ/YmgE (transglycosylase-associated protein family)
LLISKQNPIRANAATKIRYFSDRLLAEQFMHSNMGLLMNIVLGIVGAAIASAILSLFGIVLGGWIGYLICGFIGACLLIWIVRAVRARS